MHIVKEQESMDAVAEADDMVQVELQDAIIAGTKTLYVHVNGRTVLRIGRIKTKVDFDLDDAPGTKRTLGPDLVKGRDGFSNAIATLATYKRRDAWAYIGMLEAVIEKKDKEIDQLADAVIKAEQTNGQESV